MITADVTAEFKRIAAERFPNEAVMAYWPDGTWRELTNQHPRPQGEFLIRGEELKLLQRKPPLVLVHSHTSGHAFPSDDDTVAQIASGYVWAVISVQGTGDAEKGYTLGRIGDPEYFGDGAPQAPLHGRRYLHGVRDCYTLLQSFYAKQGIHIPTCPRVLRPDTYPRNHPYAHDLFGFHIRKQGLWTRIQAYELEPGDAVLFELSHPFHDHCAVYAGEGKYLEQTALRRSGFTTYERSYLSERNAHYYRLKDYNAQDRASWCFEEGATTRV